MPGPSTIAVASLAKTAFCEPAPCLPASDSPVLTSRYKNADNKALLRKGS